MSVEDGEEKEDLWNFAQSRSSSLNLFQGQSMFYSRKRQRRPWSVIAGVFIVVTFVLGELYFPHKLPQSVLQQSAYQSACGNKIACILLYIDMKTVSQIVLPSISEFSRYLKRNYLDHGILLSLAPDSPQAAFQFSRQLGIASIIDSDDSIRQALGSSRGSTLPDWYSVAKSGWVTGSSKGIGFSSRQDGVSVSFKKGCDAVKYFLDDLGLQAEE